MPYSGPDDPDLPANVKKLSTSKKKKWIATFESVLHTPGKSESDAFAIANGTIKSLEEEDFIEENKGIIARVLDYFKSWVTTEEGEKEKSVDQTSYEETTAPPDTQPADAAAQAPVPANSTLYFYKDGERVRFLTVYSNCFKDRQGEVITSIAHKDYVQWVDDTKNYPDLWLWHGGPSSKWGKADFIDYVDGFAIASGLVDQGKEYISEELAKQQIGVSHGFKALVDNGNIIRYRTFEISPLPIESSANSITAFSSKELSMPFTEKKKAWLKDVAKLTDEAITEWESNLAKLGDQLKGLGIEWKETEVDDVTGQIAALTKAMTDVTAVVVPLVEVVKKLNTDMDTKVAAVFQAEIAKLPQGYKASTDDKNVVDKKQNDNNLAWFGEVVSKGVK